MLFSESLRQAVRHLPQALGVSCNPALQLLSSARRVLLLQGPVGPFFDRLTLWLHSRQALVRRVALHAGDMADIRHIRPDRFTGTPAEWPAYLNAMVRDWGPDCVVLFGQARYYHQVARILLKDLSIPVVVLEEGYFRPGYATMELSGVNSYSTTLDRYVWHPKHSSASPPAADETPNHFLKMASHAARHYVAMERGRNQFPHYVHHRSTDLSAYAAYWIRSWMRKGWFRKRDLQFQRALFSSGLPYYFVPLQLEGDSQLTTHSRFKSNTEFIDQVLGSFAMHAPAGTRLIIKQHPYARGGQSLAGHIGRTARKLGVAGRVKHISEGDTPDLAEHSRGTVLINSTVGLQAIERGSPLMVLGDALYKRPGIAFDGGLDDFWTDGRAPNPLIASTFLRQLKSLTQVPVSLYATPSTPLSWASAL